MIKIGPIINPAPGGLLGAGLIGSSEGIILTHTQKAFTKKAHWVSSQAIISSIGKC